MSFTGKFHKKKIKNPSVVSGLVHVRLEQNVRNRN